METINIKTKLHEFEKIIYDFTGKLLKEGTTTPRTSLSNGYILNQLSDFVGRRSFLIGGTTILDNQSTTHPIICIVPTDSSFVCGYIKLSSGNFGQSVFLSLLDTNNNTVGFTYEITKHTVVTNGI